MQVLIDADGCPVVDIAVKLCVKAHVPCRIFCDTAHCIERPNAVTTVVDKGADSVDLAIVRQVQPNDIVITQDYGLAAMSLAKRARVLHQDGHMYTEENIDALLLFRHEAARYRRSGGRLRGQPKRTKQQDRAFSEQLTSLLFPQDK